MRKIIYGMMQSLDGYVAGPAGGPGLPMPEAALHRHFNEAVRNSAVELYGRRMYEVMRYWDGYAADDAQDYETEFAGLWQATPKVVVSTTLNDAGPNTRIIGNDVETTIRALKAGGDGIINVAGPTLAASLSRMGLIDEYHLYLMPVVLGGGKPFFAAGSNLKLTPLGSESLPQDVVLLRYAPAA